MPTIKPFFFDLTEAEIAEFQQGAAEILRSGVLILGEYTARFEKVFAEFIGSKHAIAVNSREGQSSILIWIQRPLRQRW